MLREWTDRDGTLDWWLEYIGATFAFAPAKVAKGSAEYIAWVEAVTAAKVRQAEFIEAVKEARDAGKDRFTPTDMLQAVRRVRAIGAQERERLERDQAVAGYQKAISATPARKRLMRAVSGVLDKAPKPERRLEAARAVVTLMDEAEFGRGNEAKRCKATYTRIAGELESQLAKGDGDGRRERGAGAAKLAADVSVRPARQPAPRRADPAAGRADGLPDSGLRGDECADGRGGAGDPAGAAGAAAADVGEDLLNF